MRKLILFAVIGLGMTIMSDVTSLNAQGTGRVYELRTYTCNEGKLPDLLKRFRDDDFRAAPYA
jgi:hypothetical protein